MSERDPLEEQADDLERKNEELGKHIKETREDWESKKGAESVPGAQPDEDEQRDGPPPEADVTPGD
jgi:hypothetical protein